MKTSKLNERIAKALAIRNVPGIIPKRDHAEWVENNWRLWEGDAKTAAKETRAFFEEVYKHMTDRPSLVTEGMVRAAVDVEIRRLEETFHGELGEGSRDTTPRQEGRIVMVETHGWMPIETAPKDGRFILVGYDCGDDYFSDNPDAREPKRWIVGIVYWWWKGPRKKKGNWMVTDGDLAEDQRLFTHWMPVPGMPGMKNMSDPCISPNYELTERERSAEYKRVFGP